MVIYQVFHCYDVDGGFGDAIYQEQPVMAFSKRKDAEEFVKTYEREIVYDHPYDYLSCGELDIAELVVMDSFNKDSINTESFWWLNKKDILAKEAD